MFRPGSMWAGGSMAGLRDPQAEDEAGAGAMAAPRSTMQAVAAPSAPPPAAGLNEGGLPQSEDNGGDWFGPFMDKFLGRDGAAPGGDPAAGGAGGVVDMRQIPGGPAQPPQPPQTPEGGGMISSTSDGFFDRFDKRNWTDEERRDLVKALTSARFGGY